MAPSRRRLRRPDLPLVLAPLGVVLAATLVAAASRANGGFHGGAGAGSSHSAGADFFTIVLIVVALGTAAWAYLLIVRRDLVELPTSERRHRQVFSTIAIILAIAAFAMIARRLGFHGINFHRFHFPFLSHGSSAPKAHGRNGTGTAVAHGHLSWVAALAAAAFLIAAVAAAWYSSRTTAQPAKEAAQDQAEAVSAALEESLAELRAEPDPRRAIIAAYAYMERALAAAGVRRRPAEAPLEFLERALVELDVTDASARRLTDLFRFAKFSDHPVDVQAKEDAIEALEAVRDELRGLT